ncbi:MAG: hypothetical protein EZS28_007150 [Streblomastix strix]|uniref:Uncharacterized protein n=1 Tax=Streblomastix strix TaxID=222440 RepID=A0A5J4WQW2_9EUKA|nr:MAG: hypothetical protein EZS28_007150 [Streblomastix strix]
MEHNNNGNADEIPKEVKIKVVKASDGTIHEKEAHKNIRLGISNWRNQIYRSTIQMRCASNLVALKAQGQGSSQERLEQVNSIQKDLDTRHNMLYLHDSSLSSIEFHKTKQWENTLCRRIQLRIWATLIRKNQEKVFTYGEWKDNNLNSSNK